jgi:hypothetical protein
VFNALVRKRDVRGCRSLAGFIEVPYKNLLKNPNSGFFYRQLNCAFPSINGPEG